MLTKGIVIPSFTVFDDNEELDMEATLDHIWWLVDNGADAIVPCGSSGEWPSLSNEEVKGIISNAVSTDRKVYAATGRYSTRETIALSQFAEKHRVDGIMICPPPIMLPNSQAVMEHLRSIHKAVKIPIIYYNNPWMYGVELSPYQLDQLINERVIQGVKVSQGDPFKTQELKYLCENKGTVYYGHDYGALESLLAGADGWFTAILNVFPKQAKLLWNARNDIEQAKAIWNETFLPYLLFTMKMVPEAHPLAIYKATLNILGRKVGQPRRPIMPLTDKQYHALQTFLDR